MFKVNPSIRKITFSTAIIWICGILIIFKMNPYFSMTTFLSGKLSFLPVFAMGGFLGLTFLIILKSRIGYKKLYLTFFIILIYILNNTIPYYTVTLQQAGNYLLVIAFLLIPITTQGKIWNAFSWIFAISLIPGIIIMILLSLGINLPSQVLVPESSITASRVYFNNYFFAINMHSYTSGTQNVLQGIFDERGVVGTFAVLFLVADEYKLKGNIKNIIIFLSGILSLSLAFIVITGIYLVFRLLKRHNWKSLAKIVLIFVLYMMFIKIDFSNPYLIYVQDRIEIIDGQLSGDNRVTPLFDEAYSQYMHGDTVNVLFGYGIGTASQNTAIAGSSSYKIAIIDYGYIGFSLIVLWFSATILLLFENKFSIILFLLVFIVSLYQRPNVMNIAYMVALFGGAANLAIKKYNISQGLDRNIEYGIE
ncbi:MAG: hypothetical protein RBQ97_02755 [Acholeplasma sp.]|nr:hypothetical protein [Acholeplasma sp.]